MIPCGLSWTVISFHLFTVHTKKRSFITQWTGRQPPNFRPYRLRSVYLLAPNETGHLDQLTGLTEFPCKHDLAKFEVTIKTGVWSYTFLQIKIFSRKYIQCERKYMREEKKKLASKCDGSYGGSGLFFLRACSTSDYLISVFSAGRNILLEYTYYKYIWVISFGRDIEMCRHTCGAGSETKKTKSTATTKTWMKKVRKKNNNNDFKVLLTVCENG